MHDEDDPPWSLASRSLGRRIARARGARVGLRRSGNRALLRWWSRAVPLWPPSVQPWSGPFPARARRRMRRPVVRSRRCA